MSRGSYRDRLPIISVRCHSHDRAHPSASFQPHLPALAPPAYVEGYCKAATQKWAAGDQPRALRTCPRLRRARTPATRAVHSSLAHTPVSPLSSASWVTVAGSQSAWPVQTHRSIRTRAVACLHSPCTRQPGQSHLTSLLRQRARTAASSTTTHGARLACRSVVAASFR